MVWYCLKYRISCVSAAAQNILFNGQNSVTAVRLIRGLWDWHTCKDLIAHIASQTLPYSTLYCSIKALQSFQIILNNVTDCFFKLHLAVLRCYCCSWDFISYDSLHIQSHRLQVWSVTDTNVSLYIQWQWKRWMPCSRLKEPGALSIKTSVMWMIWRLQTVRRLSWLCCRLLLVRFEYRCLL